LQSGPERSRARSVRRSEPLTARTARPHFRKERKVGRRALGSNSIQRCSPKLFFRATTTVATLPSALFDERFFRSVQVGCSRFSRCCHLIIDLSSISTMEVGPGVRRSHRNSALNLWASCLVFSSPWIETTPRPATRLVAGCAVVRTLPH